MLVKCDKMSKHDYFYFDLLFSDALPSAGVSVKTEGDSESTELLECRRYIMD